MTHVPRCRARASSSHRKKVGAKMASRSVERGMAMMCVEATHLHKGEVSPAHGRRDCATMDAPEQGEERRDPADDEGEVSPLASLLKLCPRERKHAAQEGRARPSHGASFARRARQEGRVDDGAREDGVQGRGEVGLDEEEEDLLVGDGEQRWTDDGRVGV